MKVYNNEKAIISLTSWKGRISFTATTIKSLLEQCKGFHIVLVLSSDEFTNKLDDLPNDLLELINKDKVEVLWIKKNFYSFKKVLFTIQKYPTVPVIGADDGVIYTENFAERLYERWENGHKNFLISTSKYYVKKFKLFSGSGERGILYPPGIFLDYIYLLDYPEVIQTMHDDIFIAVLADILKIPWIFLNHVNTRPKVCYQIPEGEKVGMRSNKLYNHAGAIKFFKKFLKDKVKIKP